MISAPTIQLVAPPPPQDVCYRENPWMLPILEVGRRLWSFHWLIFTSANAVRLADELWSSMGGLNGVYHYPQTSMGVQHSDPPKIICVGSATQDALNQLGVEASLVPKDFHTEGILELLATRDLPGQTILIPRALVAREKLPNVLRAQGAEVWISPVYQTLGAQLSDQVKGKLMSVSPTVIRYLVFPSDSTVHRLIAQLGVHELNILQKYTRVIVIGPIVKRAASAAGFNVCRVAQPHTIEGVIEGLTIDYQEMPHEGLKR